MWSSRGRPGKPYRRSSRLGLRQHERRPGAELVSDRAKQRRGPAAATAGAPADARLPGMLWAAEGCDTAEISAARLGLILMIGRAGASAPDNSIHRPCHGEVGNVVVGGVLPPPGDTVAALRRLPARPNVCASRARSEAVHANLIIRPTRTRRPQRRASSSWSPGSNTICVATVLPQIGNGRAAQAGYDGGSSRPVVSSRCASPAALPALN